MPELPPATSRVIPFIRPAPRKAANPEYADLLQEDVPLTRKQEALYAAEMARARADFLTLTRSVKMHEPSQSDNIVRLRQALRF